MEPHPVRFWVDYPDRLLNRMTSAFRFVTIIPIAILLGLLDHANASYQTSGGSGTWVMAGTGGGAVLAPVVLMLLFREKYPRWWYDWNLELARFGNRVVAYWLLMDDRYPSTDDHQAVHLDYPEVTTLRAMCAAEGTQAFVLTCAPLAIPGGTGSAVNPIATF